MENEEVVKMKLPRKIAFVILIVFTLGLMFVPVVQFKDSEYVSYEKAIEKAENNYKDKQFTKKEAEKKLSEDTELFLAAMNALKDEEPELYRLYQERDKAKKVADEGAEFFKKINQYDKDIKDQNKLLKKAETEEEKKAIEDAIQDIEQNKIIVQQEAFEYCKTLGIPGLNTETFDEKADYAGAANTFQGDKLTEATNALASHFLSIYSGIYTQFSAGSDEATAKGRELHKDKLDQLEQAVSDAKAKAEDAGITFKDSKEKETDKKIAELKDAAEKEKTAVQGSMDKMRAAAKDQVKDQYEAAISTCQAELDALIASAEEEGLKKNSDELDGYKNVILDDEIMKLVESRAKEVDKAREDGLKDKEKKEVVDEKKAELQSLKEEIIREKLGNGDTAFAGAVQELQSLGINTEDIISDSIRSATAENDKKRITVESLTAGEETTDGTETESAESEGTEKEETVQEKYDKLNEKSKKEGRDAHKNEIDEKETKIRELNEQFEKAALAVVGEDGVSVEEQLKDKQKLIDLLDNVIDAAEEYVREDELAIKEGKKLTGNVEELEKKIWLLQDVGYYYVCKCDKKKLDSFELGNDGLPKKYGNVIRDEEDLAGKDEKLVTYEIAIDEAKVALEEYNAGVENGTISVVETYKFALLPGRLSISLNPKPLSAQYKAADKATQQKMDELSAKVDEIAKAALDESASVLDAKRNEIDDAIIAAEEAGIDKAADKIQKIDDEIKDKMDQLPEEYRAQMQAKIDEYNAKFDGYIVEESEYNYNEYTILALDKSILNANSSYKYDLDLHYLLIWVTAGLLIIATVLVLIPGKKEKSVLYTISSFIHLIAIVLMVLCIFKLTAYPVKLPYGSAELITPVALGLVFLPIIAFAIHVTGVYNTKRSMIYVFCIFLSILALLPFWIMIVNGTRSSAQIQSSVTVIPSHYMARNWQVLNSKNFDIKVGFKNSAIIAFCSTILGVFFSALTAYGFKVYDFKGRKFLYAVVMAILMIPGQVTGTGFYMFMYQQGMVNNYLPLIIPSIAAASTVFFFRQYLEANLQLSLVEASRIDGASEFYTFVKIILPIMLPAMATMGIMAVIGSWNNYLTPLMLLSKAELKTLPMMVKELRGDIYRTEYGSIYLGLTLTALPLMIIYFALSKFIIAGVALGGVKE